MDTLPINTNNMVINNNTSKDSKTDPSSYVCQFCSYNCVYEIELESHLLIAHRQKKCKICLIYIDLIKNRMNSHLEKHVEHKCKICEKKFTTKKMLDEHLQSHSSDPIFSCKECGNSFYTEEKLNGHMKRMHLNRTGKLECPKCGKMVFNNNLKNHIKSKCPANTFLKCTDCEKYFHSKRSLFTHIDRNHRQIIERINCQICGKLIRRNSLSEHKQMHRDIDSNSEFKCGICGKIFNTRKKMVIHNSAKHGEKSNRINFQCHLCPKTFYSKDILNEHLDIHAGIRKFKCSQCDKAFVTQRNLDTHVVTHTGIKDFVCTLCGTSYYTKRALAWHIKLRHGDLKDYYEKRKQIKTQFETKEIEIPVQPKISLPTNRKKGRPKSSANINISIEQQSDICHSQISSIAIITDFPSNNLIANHLDENLASDYVTAESGKFDLNSTIDVTQFNDLLPSDMINSQTLDDSINLNLGQLNDPHLNQNASVKTKKSKTESGKNKEKKNDIGYSFKKEKSTDCDSALIPLLCVHG